jgi:hypothetical protein
VVGLLWKRGGRIDLGAVSCVSMGGLAGVGRAGNGSESGSEVVGTAWGARYW